MSPKEFADSMKKRGESFFQMFLTMIAHGMAQEADGRAPSDFEVMMALLSKDRDLKLKRILAGQFEQVDTLNAALGGPGGSTLLTERNKVALRVLKERLEEGDQNVAIFYGAGHLPDFHERLQKEFGMELDDVSFVTAWDLD
jgi:hypothetical protein